MIERPDLVDVQKYDTYYTDFRNIIQEIMKTTDEDDEILLNVSSGTPAMKSGLLVLSVLGEFPCVPIQVATPARKMNEHTHEGYDVEALWELDEDNDPDKSVNRCEAVYCPTLSLIKQQEILLEMIRKYDDAGAMDIAETIENAKGKINKELVQIAYERNQLNLSGAMSLAKKNHLDIFPVKSGNDAKLFEYMANLIIKCQKEEYVDFVRALTPLIADLFELILKDTKNLLQSQILWDDGFRT